MPEFKLPLIEKQLPHRLTQLYFNHTPEEEAILDELQVGGRKHDALRRSRLGPPDFDKGVTAEVEKAGAPPDQLHSEEIPGY